MSTLVTEQIAVVPNESRGSAVSWASIAAGGVAAAGFSLFLLQLGAGIGLSVVSPWESAPSGTTTSIVTGISVCLISIMASALGGYIAGRLRARWVGLHIDETYFRDTAHGFLAWAFATIISAIVVTSMATSLLGSATQGATAGAAANAGPTSANTSYYTDMLFRSDNPTAPPASPGAQASNDEVGRILSRGLTGNGLTDTDRTYVAQRVAARTGLSQEEAQRRVDTVIAQAKNAADTARKAAAKTALWMAGALLCGALAAAFAAAEGGRERDE